jgi:hypothetical protein
MIMTAYAADRIAVLIVDPYNDGMELATTLRSSRTRPLPSTMKADKWRTRSMDRVSRIPF